METAKRAPGVHEDRSGVPRLDNPAHTDLSAVRGAGSPEERLYPPAPMSEPCAGLSENSVWQSASGATASLVVTFDEAPRTNLGTTATIIRGPVAAASTSSEPSESVETAWAPLVERWQAHLEERGLAPGTRRAYRDYVTRTFTWIGKQDLRNVIYGDLEDEGRRRSEEWHRKRGRPLKPSAKNARVASLQSFYRYLVDKLDLDQHGVRDLGRKLDLIRSEIVVREKTTREPLTLEEFRAIIRTAESADDLRWSLAARFAWTSMGRVSDISSLSWAQLRLDARPQAVYARPSKHGANLTKLLDSGLAKRLRDYRELKRPEPADPVFSAGASAKAYRDYFDRRFKTYAAETGCTKHVHPHAIRSSVSSHAAANGVPRELRDRQGGWFDPSARDGYERQDPEVFRDWVRVLAV